MRLRILKLGMLITSLFGYLQWGQDNRAFLFEAEAELMTHIGTDPGAWFNPFVMIPLAGQLLLLIATIRPQPARWLTFAGAAGITLLMAMLVFVGVLSGNTAVWASTLPFWTCSIAMLVTMLLRFPATTPKPTAAEQSH